jgi:hypothetical protein
VFHHKCECGYNTSGTAYCTPALGDDVGQSYLAAAKAFIRTGAVRK